MCFFTQYTSHPDILKPKSCLVRFGLVRLLFLNVLVTAEAEAVRLSLTLSKSHTVKQNLTLCSMRFCFAECNFENTGLNR